MDPVSTQMVVMNQIGQWSSAFMEHVRSALLALVIFILGLLAAEVARFAGAALLRILRWDAFCERTGAAAALHKVRPDVTPSTAAGGVLFWFTLFSFFMQALKRLDIAWLSNFGRVYFDFLPAFFQTLGILLVAWVLALWLARLILLVVEHPAGFLGAGLVQALVLSLGLYSGLVTLGVQRELAQPLILILLAAAVFGVALAWALNRNALFRPVVRVRDDSERE